MTEEKPKGLPEKIANEIFKSRIEFSNIVVKRNGAPPNVREWISKYGNRYIERIFVCRRPISGAIRKLANIITFGEFNKTLKGLHYEDLYHLLMYIKIGNKTFILEKNEVVSLRELNKKTQERGLNCLEVNLGTGVLEEEEEIGGETLYSRGLAFQNPKRTIKKKTTLPPRRIKLVDFMKNGEQQQVDFWDYNANGNNCQVFAESLLVGNGLINKYDRIHTFIKQDVEQIFLQNPKYIEDLGKKATDFAAIWNLLKYGP